VIIRNGNDCDLYRISWAMVFIVFAIWGSKMSIDEYQFRMNTPILYGFYTSEIGIRNMPYPTLTLLPAEAFKQPSVQRAKQ
jgi:hypothetical protein